MTSLSYRIGAAIGALACAGAAWAVAPGQHVDNFALLDQQGKYHDLYYLSDAKAVVLMTHASRCAAVQSALPRFEQLKASYASRGVEFLLINPADDRKTVAKSAADGIPVLVDETRLVGESLQLNRAAEVMVIDPKGWKVAYRGALDAAGATAAGAKHGKFAAAALDSILAGEPVPASAAATKGCEIKLPDPAREAAKVSYSKHIAPLLQDNCVTCHRHGGIGPFAMTDYTIVRGFAPMIREVVRTKRMPPWHADPHVGVFAADRSLTDKEAQMLVHWIEAGAPRGDGPDPLAESKKTWPQWSFGEPDFVIELPAFDMPATGTVDYQYYTVANPTGRDVWLRATDVIPGDRSVLHHIITGISDPALPERERRIRAVSGELGGYAPGNGPFLFPEDTGVLMPKHMSFAFQVHYTTSGKATRDVTRVGFYFSKEPPKYEMKTAILAKTSLLVPANTKAYSDSTTRNFEQEVLMYSLTPHAHYRGKASSFVAVYPDGREELLLSVPKYDFNWQTTYTFVKPKVMPAGTRIVHSTTYDNSAQNPSNPDPNRVVPWGQQSWDEMLYGVIRYREMVQSPAVQVTQSR